MSNEYENKTAEPIENMKAKSLDVPPYSKKEIEIMILSKASKKAIRNACFNILDLTSLDTTRLASDGELALDGVHNPEIVEIMDKFAEGFENGKEMLVIIIIGNKTFTFADSCFSTYADGYLSIGFSGAATGSATGFDLQIDLGYEPGAYTMNIFYRES